MPNLYELFKAMEGGGGGKGLGEGALALSPQFLRPLTLNFMDPPMQFTCYIIQEFRSQAGY